MRKDDFPLLKNRKIVYLDSAATSQKPSIVIEAMNDFYTRYNSNVHRGVYSISEEATLEYEKAREKVAEFINALPSEIIFTRGTTESLNLLAYSLIDDLKENDEILLSEMEHHSNLVPWQQLAKKNNIKLKFIHINKNGQLDFDPNLINNKTKIVSLVHVSNVLGTINDIKKIAKEAHDKGALFILDGAQSVGHMKIDVKDLDVDFLAFSSHKMLGPMGIGVLYGKSDLLETMNPFLYGGDMIKQVSLYETRFNDVPWKFEAGTPNVASVIGLKKAIEYINEIGIDDIEKHNRKLVKYTVEKLKKLGIKVYGTPKLNVISFNIDGMHPHDVSSLLNQNRICIRGGHMCCMPLMKKLSVNGVCRVSFNLYNEKKDVDELIKALNEILILAEKNGIAV
ncbi:cysteine desulfurase [Candidatus Woesearchaeota archaeon]|nr:cysteine desulfurase [Candidatus Woesearchaeota archaeon]